MHPYVYWLRFLIQESWIRSYRTDDCPWDDLNRGWFIRISVDSKWLFYTWGQNHYKWFTDRSNHMWPQSTTEFTVTWVAMANIYSNSDPDFEWFLSEIASQSGFRGSTGFGQWITAHNETESTGRIIFAVLILRQLNKPNQIFTKLFLEDNIFIFLKSS